MKASNNLSGWNVRNDRKEQMTSFRSRYEDMIFRISKRCQEGWEMYRNEVEAVGTEQFAVASVKYRPTVRIRLFCATTCPETWITWIEVREQRKG